MGLLEALRSVVKGSMSALGYPSASRLLAAIHHDARGVGIVLDPLRDASCHSILPWQEIVEVRAFKRDLFAVDLLCLSFLTSGGATLEVNEEMGGWADLFQALPAYLPGCMGGPEISDAVIKPAFATNEVLVFSRRGRSN